MGRFISLDQASVYLGVPRDTLYWWRKERRKDRPPDYKIGRRIMYDREELDEWLQSRKCKV